MDSNKIEIAFLVSGDEAHFMGGKLAKCLGIPVESIRVEKDKKLMWADTETNSLSQRSLLVICGLSKAAKFGKLAICADVEIPKGMTPEDYEAQVEEELLQSIDEK